MTREKVRKELCCLTAALLLFDGSIDVEPAYVVTVPQIASEGTALYNATMGQLLHEKNANQQFYLASTAEFMTTLLVLKSSS